MNYLTIALKEEPRIGEYWVGMVVTELSDEERKKLETPADRGIIVRQIVPDSPAAKSSLKVGDILLKAGDKPLKELVERWRLSAKPRTTISPSSTFATARLTR